MSDLSDERVRWIANDFLDAPPNVPGPSGSEIAALARQVLALRERVAELTKALAGDARVITGNEAGRHVACLMRQMAERHPELRDGLLEIANDVERKAAFGDEELAYQRGLLHGGRDIATLTRQRDEAVAVAREAVGELGNMCDNPHRCPHCDSWKARLAAITGGTDADS